LVPPRGIEPLSIDFQSITMTTPVPAAINLLCFYRHTLE